MDIVPLGPGFGAELRAVSLTDVACDDVAYAAARAAFEAHSLLVLRNQQVTDEIQLAFSRRFGPPEVTKVGSQGTGTNFVILTTIGADGKVVPSDHRMAMRNKANQLWHTDSSFKRMPALASILSARSIPGHGGETEFVSTRLAFERPDRGRPRNARGTRGVAAAMLADGMAQPRQRPRCALPCFPHLCRRRHGSRRRQEADRRFDGGSDRAGDELPASMAQGRRRDVG